MNSSSLRLRYKLKSKEEYERETHKTEQASKKYVRFTSLEEMLEQASLVDHASVQTQLILAIRVDAAEDDKFPARAKPLHVT